MVTKLLVLVNARLLFVGSDDLPAKAKMMSLLLARQTPE
jgi:hypothetical protein